MSAVQIVVKNRFSERDRPTIKCGKGRTRQAFKDECDINKIMERYRKTGTLDHLNRYGASYDFATGETFQDAMNVVAQANTMFEELPSHLRKMFHNKPEAFLDFVQDPSNNEKMVELGLARKKEPPQQQTQVSAPKGASQTAPEPQGAANSGEPVPPNAGGNAGEGGSQAPQQAPSQ